MCKQKQDQEEEVEFGNGNGNGDSIDPQDPGCCIRCGDPLPVDGHCDCAGDAERDCVSGWRGLQAHPVFVRLGPDTDGWRDGDADSVGEVWI